MQTTAMQISSIEVDSHAVAEEWNVSGDNIFSILAAESEGLEAAVGDSLHLLKLSLPRAFHLKEFFFRCAHTEPRV